MSTIEFAYNRFCTERFPLPSEKQVAEFEERIGVPLPPDYREFLLQFNGGLFSEPEIRPPSNKDCPVDRLTYLRGLGALNPLSIGIFFSISMADYSENRRFLLPPKQPDQPPQQIYPSHPPSTTRRPPRARRVSH